MPDDAYDFNDISRIVISQQAVKEMNRDNHLNSRYSVSNHSRIRLV